MVRFVQRGGFVWFVLSMVRFVQVPLNITSQSVQSNVKDLNLSSDIEILTYNESDYSGESMNSV